MWKLLITIMFFALISIVPLAAPAMYSLYKPYSNLTEDSRAVSSDVARVPKKMLGSSAGSGEASIPAGHSSIRRTRMVQNIEADPTYLKERLNNLATNLKEKGACIGEYLNTQGVKDIEEKIGQAEEHLKALDNFESTMKKIRDSCLPGMWKDDEYNGFFDASGLAYQSIKRKSEEARSVLDDVEDLNEKVDKTIRKLNEYGADVSEYGSLKLSSNDNDDDAWSTLLTLKNHLMYIREIKYLENRLKSKSSGFLDSFFRIEGLSERGVRKEYYVLLALMDVLDYAAHHELLQADEEDEEDEEARRFRHNYMWMVEKLKKESYREKVNEMHTLVKKLRNNSNFKLAIKDLRREIKEKCKSLVRKEKKDVKDDDYYDRSSFRKIFDYIDLSIGHDPEGTWTYNLVERFNHANRKLYKLRLLRTSDC
jgi:hypothetical protein